MEDSEKVKRTSEKPNQCAEKDAVKIIEYENKICDEERPCQLVVIDIVDKDLSNSGIKVDSVLKAINDTVLIGKPCSEQIRLLSETPKPFTLTFIGKKFKKTAAPLNSCPDHGHDSILNELTAFGDNEVKKYFNQIVKGTLLEQELKSSKDKNKTILELLGNQRRLLDLLQNYTVKIDKEPEYQEFKE